MKKYLLLVEGESRKLQKTLFGAGFQWIYAGESVQNYPTPYFMAIEDGVMMRGNSWADVVKSYETKEFTLIMAHEIIQDPLALDGAKSPEKTVTLSDGTEISEGTIKSLMKRYGEER